MRSRSKRWANRVLAALALITVLLGLVGYGTVGLKPEETAGTSTGFGKLLDLLYASLQLLLMGGKETRGNLFLEWARWFGALFAFGVLVRIVVPQVGDRLRRWWIRSTFSGHRVVIGLGARGRTLTRLITEETAGAAQPRVIAMDADADKVDDADDVLFTRRGLVLLAGDAREDRARRDAVVAQADSVVIVTESESKNIEIAREVAVDAVARRRHAQPLRVYAHVLDPVLRRESFAGASYHERALLRPFSLPAEAARRLVREFPPPVVARDGGTPGVNVAFVGFDAYAEELLVHVVRLGPLAGQRSPRVTVFARDADHVRERLLRNYPALGGLTSHLEFAPLDPAADLSSAELARAEPADAPLTVCFVHAADDASCFALALRTRRAAQRHGFWKAPLFMRVADAAPFAALLKAQFGASKVPEQTIRPYGELTATLTSVLDAEWREVMAQVLHRAYRENQEGKTGASQPLARPPETKGPGLVERLQGMTDVPRRFPVTPTEVAWCRLSEELRESNRRAVEHFPLKLASAGYIVRGEMPLLAGSFQLTDETVDLLARLEHDSWCRDKWLAGWRLGLPRDDLRRVHGDLKPFDELKGAQQKDISQVRKIEKQLRDADHPELARLLGDERRLRGPSVFRERVIGLAGHLLMSPDVAKFAVDAVGARLEQLGAVDRLGPDGDEFWTFVTPLAPGGDYILASAVLDWLARKPGLNRPRRRYRMLIVQDLPLRVLVEMWRAKGGFAKGTPDGLLTGTHPDYSSGDTDTDDAALVALLRSFVERRDEVERFVDLARPGTLSSDYQSAASRHAALDRTNDYLLSHCDDLIVALDPRNYAQDVFDRARWRALGADELPRAGVGALVRAWLQPRVRRRASAVPALDPDGLHCIELPPAADKATAEEFSERAAPAASRRVPVAVTSLRRSLFMRIIGEGKYKRGFRNEAFARRQGFLAPDGAEPLIAVAEGDSWFDYPTLLDFLDHVQASGWVNVWRVSHMGDTLAQMVGSPQLDATKALVRELAPDIVLLSCGGNDIMGRSGLLGKVILPKSADRRPADAYQFLDARAVVDHIEKELIDHLTALTRELFAVARSVGRPHLRIFIHGYDYAFPDGRAVMPAVLERLLGGPWLPPLLHRLLLPLTRPFAVSGPWLSPALYQLRYLDSTRPRGAQVMEARAVIRELMDAWNDALRRFAARSGGRIVYVDLRNLLDERTKYWVNETHPNEDGFRIVAEKLLDDVLMAMRRR